MFSDFACTCLENVIITDEVSELGDSVFLGCSNLKSVTFTADNLSDIGLAVFSGCESLKSVTVPDGVTEIDAFAFQNCKAIKRVTVPKSLGIVRFNAFDNCANLKEVFYAGSESDWNDITFGAGNTKFSDAEIHYNSTVYEEKYYTKKDGTKINLHAKFSRDNEDIADFGKDFPSKLKNLETLGVQKKKTGEKSIRFIVVAKDEILKDADDYGFILKGAETREEVSSKIESLTYENAQGLRFSCRETSNNVSGDYGKYNSEKIYKYITFGVNNIGENSVAAKFYVKKGEKIYYATYTNSNYETSNICAVNWDIIK